MPPNQPDRYTWTSKLWGAICCARPGANTSGALAARGFFTSAARCSSRWNRRCWTCRQPAGFRADKFEVRGDAKRFETWESAPATTAGFRRCHRICAGARAEEWIERRVQELWPPCCGSGWASVKGVTVQDLGRVRSGIVTFTCEGHAAGEVMQGLKENGIAVRVSDRVVDPHRHGTARARRAGQGIRALLQHRRGNRAALRRTARYE